MAPSFHSQPQQYNPSNKNLSLDGKLALYFTRRPRQTVVLIGQSVADCIRPLPQRQPGGSLAVFSEQHSRSHRDD